MLWTLCIDTRARSSPLVFHINLHKTKAWNVLDKLCHVSSIFAASSCFFILRSPVGSNAFALRNALQCLTES